MTLSSRFGLQHLAVFALAAASAAQAASAPANFQQNLLLAILNVTLVIAFRSANTKLGRSA